MIAQTILSENTRLPFSALAGIRLVAVEETEKSEELFQAAFRARLPGQDVLIAREGDEVKSIRGRLETLEAQRGAFVLGERSRPFQTEKMYGVVFAAGLARSTALPVTVELSDGSSFAGTIERADESTIRIGASFGTALDVATSRVVKLTFRSPRVVYVSDLSPVGERVEGLVHRPWPIRRDLSVSAKPLSIDGRVFDKGLGVHSRTELDYDLGGGYELFVATVGIDDAVRPLGSVVFRVIGDGRTLWDSGSVSGLDAPREVRVEVGGVKRLTLAVDYGDGLDLSDQADWGGARLIRPVDRKP